MWERLLYWEANNYIMCASIDRDHGKPGEKGTPGDKDGLIGQHAYSLLAAYEADEPRQWAPQMLNMAHHRERRRRLARAAVQGRDQRPERLPL